MSVCQEDIEKEAQGHYNDTCCTICRPYHQKNVKNIHMQKPLRKLFVSKPNKTLTIAQSHTPFFQGYLQMNETSFLSPLNNHHQIYLFTHLPSSLSTTIRNALATPRPRQPDKIMPDGARQKIAGSIWFPGPKIWRKIEGSWPDWARQHQILSLFVIKVKFWHCLVQSGQLPSSFLQTFGQGSKTEPATFSSGSVWHDFVWLSGLGVASPSCPYFR